MGEECREYEEELRKEGRQEILRSLGLSDSDYEELLARKAASSSLHAAATSSKIEI